MASQVFQVLKTQYWIGASQNLAAYQKVLVDCRRFSFGRAPILAPTYLKPPIPEVTGAADFG